MPNVSISYSLSSHFRQSIASLKAYDVGHSTVGWFWRGSHSSGH